MSTTKPLILLSNDDGIDSPGIWALVEKLYDLGDLVVSAPETQQSGAGCSIPINATGRIIPRVKTINGNTLTIYGVDGSPVQAVQHGAIEFADRMPDLVVSGINYGENIGASILVSGTVGAALEAAILGIPAIAISQQVSAALYFSQDTSVDFSAAAEIARYFAQDVLAKGLPDGVDVLKIDVPTDATLQTPWRITRASRFKRYRMSPPKRATPDAEGRLEIHRADHEYETDSDIHALYVDKVISVTPLSANLTSRVDLTGLQRDLMDRLPAVSQSDSKIER